MTTAISVTFPQPPQVSLFEVDESDENREQILGHAINAIADYLQARESALKVCLRLFQCREAFKKSGEQGWEAFCAANFHPLGLTQGHIRNAVSSGRVAFSYLEKLNTDAQAEGASGLEKLSMSALVMMSSAPEEVREDLIKRIAERATTEAAPTARQVSQEADTLKIELAEAKGALGEKDAAILRLSNQIRDRDQDAADLRAKIDQMNRKLLEAQQASVTVVDADPRAKELRDAAEQIETQIAERKLALDRIESDASKAREALAVLDRDASAKRVAADTVARLEAHVQMMKANWTEAVIRKTRAADPENYGPLFARISNDMRVLADQIDPSLV